MSMVSSNDTNDTTVGASAPSTRLIEALAPGRFVIEVADVDRFYVQVNDDGTLFLRGARHRIERFVQACHDIGMELELHHVAFCG